MNLATLLRDHSAAQPHAIALHCGPRHLTWSEWDTQVDAVATALTRAALPPSAGHPARIAIALPNDLDFAVTLLGVMRAGLIAVPLNPGFTGRELRHVLADSGAEMLIGTGRVLAQTQGAVPRSYERIVIDDDVAQAASSPAQPLAEPDPDQLAVLLYTSGTEGAPKGAMLPHRALIANHEQLAAVSPPLLSGADTVLLALPLFHAYGLNTGLGAVLWYGATGVLAPDFAPADTAQLIAQHQISAVVGVPQMFIAWGALPDAGRLLSSLRLAVCGAAALEPPAAARFTEVSGATVQIGYGLTETAPVLVSTVVSPQIKPGSIGRPIPGVEVRLVNAAGEDVWRAGAPVLDDDDDGDMELAVSDSPGTDPGQIVVRGNNLFLGYWPDRRGGPDDGGWWATGDVAYADGDGDLFLVDRLGELILVSGFNVYPAEVEQVLMAYPGVAEAAVLGVAHPLTGQSVRAVVVLANGSSVAAAELAAHCARNLARFKCPSEIEFADTMPHSAIGKVRKSMLRDLEPAGE